MPAKKKPVVDDEGDDDNVVAAPAPAKGGKKGRRNKKDDDYWDSGAFEEDQAAAEQEAAGPGKNNEEDEEDAPVVKGGKKAKGGKAKQAVADDEDEDEKPAPAPAKGGKKGKAAAGKKAVVDDDDDEEVSPAPAPAPAPAKGGKKGKKNKKGDDYWDSGEYEKDLQAAEGLTIKEEEPVEDEEEDNKGGKKGGKKNKGKADVKPAPAPAPAAAGGKKKQQQDAPAPSSPTPAAAPAQPEAQGDKKLSAKELKEAKRRAGMVELLRQQQEDQRKRDEEKERLRKLREEEEAREAAEEAAYDEKAKQIKEAKKQKEKERLARRAEEEREEKERKAAEAREQLLQRQAQKTVATAGGGASGANKDKKPANKKKVTKKRWDDDSDDEPAATAASTSSTTTAATESKPIETFEADSWEDLADENVKVGKEKEAEEEAKRQAAAAAEEQARLQQEQEEAAKAAAAAAAAASASDKGGDQKGKGKATKVKGAKKQQEEVDDVQLLENGKEELRSPICCILGHVDTGKTSLLDKMRNTNVQEGEAGGITQQIGATFFPIENVKDQTKFLQDKLNLTMDIPGLLIIDTPGHESFTNLRSRGSSVCDLAILVVDIMHGLEQQTRESINLLRMRKTPFIVALNKVDRIYQWKSFQNMSMKESLRNQVQSSALEFDRRVKDVIGEFATESMNAILYFRNPDPRTYVSLVPTSAVSGEGIPDLLLLITQMTQKMMHGRLVLHRTLQCIVLEVKAMEGLGTTIDVILVNGSLHQGDKIVVCGLNGPIVTDIRELYTPKPMKEIRVKGAYDSHPVIKASMGIKIAAHDLDKAVAGSSILIANPGDDLEKLKRRVQKDLQSVLGDVDKSGRGVYVQASTLGSLEALMTFLKESKIPVFAVNIGPVHKKDIIRASVMLEKNPDLAVILAFDVKVEKDAAAIAEDMGVTIFTADIIYHLFDKFTAYMKARQEAKQASVQAIWPVMLKMMPGCIYNKRDPIVLGCRVEEGTLRIGTPLVVYNKETKENIDIGFVASMEKNHKNIDKGVVGDEIAVKIQPNTEPIPTYGRHFDISTGDIYSKLSRESIDVLKDIFKADLTEPDKKLIVKIKPLQGII